MAELKVTSKKYNDKDVLEVEGDVLATKIEVSNIEALTDAQLNALKVGDVVEKKTGNQKHCYVVTYKEEGKGICLTYVDGSGYMETISYDYVDGSWVFNSKDVCDVKEELSKSGLFSHKYTNQDTSDEITIITTSNIPPIITENADIVISENGVVAIYYYLDSAPTTYSCAEISFNQNNEATIYPFGFESPIEDIRDFSEYEVETTKL